MYSGTHKQMFEKKKKKKNLQRVLYLGTLIDPEKGYEAKKLHKKKA